MAPNHHTPEPINPWLPPLFRFLFRHRLAVFLLTAALTGVCLFYSMRLKMEENILDLLPGDDPLIGQYRRVLADFGQMNIMLMTVGSARQQNEAAGTEITGAADRLVSSMQASGHFKQITWRLEVESFPALLNILRAHRAALFSEENRQRLEQRIQPDSIRRILEGYKKQMLEMPAPVIAQALRRDPLGMDEFLLNKLAALYAENGPIALDQGRLMSRDRKHALVMAEPVYPATDSFHSREIIRFIDETIARIQKENAVGRIRVAYLSGHRISLENANRIKNDLSLTLTICVLAIALVSFFIYRRPLWTALTLLPTFFGGVFALGVLRWFKPDLSAIAVGCGSMLMGIAVDLGIHILYHVDQISGRRPSRDEIISMMDRLFWPLMLCSWTTIVAFVALFWSVLPGYRDLGWFAVLGFGGATLFAVFILPLMIPLRPSARVRKPFLPAAEYFPAFFAWSARHRGLLIFVLIALTLATAPGVFKLHFEGDYEKMNAVSPSVRADWDHVLSVAGPSVHSVSVVTRGANAEDNVAMNDKIYAVLKQLEGKGEVESVESIAPLLPSRPVQLGNERRWREFWNVGRIAELRKNLTTQAHALRMKPEAFEPFLQSLPGTNTPLTLADLQNSPLGRLIAMHVASAADHPIMTNVALKDTNGFDGLKAALDRAGVQYIAYHGPRLIQHIVQLIYREMIKASLITIALVLTILILYYRKPRELGLIVAPLAINLFWTFGIMGWLGIRINLMNSMVVMFIFGVVVDYAIFLATSMSGAATEKDSYLSHSSVAVMMSALTTMIGLGVLIIARHPALHSIGITSLLGIGTGLLAVFLLIPLSKRFPG